MGSKTMANFKSAEARSVKTSKKTPVVSRTATVKKMVETKPVPSSKALNQAVVANLDIALKDTTKDTITKAARSAVTKALMAAGGVVSSAPVEPGVVKFFDNDDDRLKEFVVPSVYREAGGSHTTILVYVGRNKAQHIPMDAGGLRVVSTLIATFRGDWRAGTYSAAEAAKKYLAVTHFDIAPRARAALEAIASGGGAAVIKAALDRKLEGDDVPSLPMTGLGAALRDAGKKTGSAKKTPGANLPKGRGIGAWVCEKIIAGVADAEILRLVKAEFPGAKTNAQHLNWYRNKLRREGKLS